MTDVGDDLAKIDFAKIVRHSEYNDNFSPKNLLKEYQEDLSLNAQDDESSFQEAAKQLGSESAKCDILLSPLEGEKKFLSELCELRNFREG